MNRMTIEDWINVNKDISETINYARYRMGDGNRNTTRDIWEQIERTNQNLQVIVSGIIKGQI